MALRTDDDRVSDQTPGYDKSRSYDPEAISDSENNAFRDIADNYDDTADPSQEDANINRASEIYDREANSSSSWDNHVKPKEGGLTERTYANKKTSKSFVKIAKKGGPFGIIIALLLGIAGLVSFVGGPGLLLVHVVETFTKYDWNASVLDRRNDVIINAKLKNSKSGLCTSRVSVKCKYSLMSKRQIDRFNTNNSGIRMVTGDASIRIGEKGLFYRATSIEFQGKPISPSQFRSELRKNPALRSAMYDAYNWRFLSKSYNPFLKFAGRFGFTKTAPFDPNDSNEDRNKKMKTFANQSPTLDGELETRKDYPEDCDEACMADIDQDNQDIDKRNEIKEEARKKMEAGQRAVKPGRLSSLLANASGFGTVAEGCRIPYAVNAISVGAKLRRSEQLVRFANMFLTAHSMIKAGEADPGTVSFLGDKLTKTFVDSNGTTTQSATDSFTYRNAAFGDTGVTESATLASVGGHIGGPAAGIAREFSKSKYLSTCKVITNPFAQGALLIGSIIPGVRVAGVGINVAVKTAIQQFVKGAVTGAVIGYGLDQVVNYFTQLAIDATVGEIIDDETYGELAGDLAFSGIQETYSKSASTGGGLALTPAQAAAYDNEINQTYLAQYAEYDRSNHSPFDISNPNTMLGSAYSSVLPHLVKASSSVPNAIASIQSIAASIPNLMNPHTAKAASADNYESCLDYQYRELGVATLDNCSVLYGIPPKYLDVEPNVIIDRLIAEGDIDEEGNIRGAYADFISNCFEGAPIDNENTECIADPSNKDYEHNIYRALFYIDESIEEVYIEGLPEQSAVRDVRPEQPVKPIGRYDDTSINCPDGTTDDLGIVTTNYTGSLTENEKPKIRLCRIHGLPGWGSIPGEDKISNTGATVNAAIADIVVELVEQAKSEGLSPRANSSFRFPDSCDVSTPGAPCANRGKSNHQLGIAIDFALSDGASVGSLKTCEGRVTSNDPLWKFLNANAPALGMKQLAHENWHWDTEIEANNRCPR